MLLIRWALTYALNSDWSRGLPVGTVAVTEVWPSKWCGDSRVQNWKGSRESGGFAECNTGEKEGPNHKNFLLVFQALSGLEKTTLGKVIVCCSLSGYQHFKRSGDSESNLVAKGEEIAIYYTHRRVREKMGHEVMVEVCASSIDDISTCPRFCIMKNLWMQQKTTFSWQVNSLTCIFRCFILWEVTSCKALKPQPELVKCWFHTDWSRVKVLTAQWKVHPANKLTF